MTLQPSDNLVVNAMDHLGGEVLVGRLRSTIADDEIRNQQRGSPMSAFGG